MSSSKPESDVRQWLPPDIHGGKVSEQRTLQPPSAPPTAQQLEKLQQAAYEEGRREGFEFGHKEGLERARKELEHYKHQLDSLLKTFEQPLRELDNQLERELLSLVIAVVRQLVRREVKSDPNLIIGVVREALSILPVNSRSVRLLVHPEDAELIREIYALGDTEVGWELVEDPVVDRGGCKVITETSQIDATLDSRLTSLIAPLLAGARLVDDQEENQ
ncbi:MAG: flagellar assembly protein FliH [Chromatiales bacterium]|jgi:flagellar assembly protein FliH